MAAWADASASTAFEVAVIAAAISVIGAMAKMYGNNGGAQTER